MHPNLPRGQGFTLLELLVVVALVAVAAAGVSVAVAQGLRANAERSALTGMLALLRTARLQAVTNGTPVRAQFDLSGRRLSVPGRAPVGWPTGLSVSLTTAQGLGEAFEFYPDGATSGGHIDIQHGDRRWRIDLAWLTGVARLQALP